MGTNKTRLFWVDSLGNTPYQVGGTTEFDIYQEAIDYAYTVIADLSPIGYRGLLCYVFSYNQESVRIASDSSGNIVVTAIIFPLQP